jgi:glycosyltransferase involved in cell wall biosynthesis
MRILLFTGGAGSMYCGSCLRDNALGAELLARGHDVVLAPVYTPTRTDEVNVSLHRVFFSGTSVYLEQHSSIFRHTPAFVDRLWDAEWVLRLATKRRIQVDPSRLGDLTVSMLRGEQGFQRKEIHKLLDWLRAEPPFDVVNLPFSLLLGLAEPIKRALGLPICCTLQGEDLFLDGLGEPHRSLALGLIAEAAVHVDTFMPVSRYYMEHAPAYFGIPADKMRLAPLGINLAGYSRAASRSHAAFTIGFFARIAPEKGLHVLCDAYRRLRARPGIGASRLVVAGYLAPEHKAYLDALTSRMREWGLAGEFEYRGELDRNQKIAFLHSLDVMSVPATYDEPKGMFLLEAMANGVPVVQPRRGAFTEILDATGGGLLVDPDDADALADGIRTLWRDPARRSALSAAGFAGVREHYSVARMAEAVESVYRDAVDHVAQPFRLRA